MALQPGTPPRLMLNSHCPLCEFRQRCQAETLAKDDLSLLRGLSAKEITSNKTRDLYRHPALLYFPAAEEAEDIATQAPAASGRLRQALAIRDQKIYVHGTPQLPVCATRIYFDLEGDPDRRFVYLLGMVAGRRGGRALYVLGRHPS